MIWICIHFLRWFQGGGCAEASSCWSEWPSLKSRQMINAGEGMKKREPFSYTLGGDVNWCSHYGKQYRGCLKKLKIELPYDPAISRLSIYPDETIIQKETCTPMFIAALFTIAKTRKQPKCLLTEEWIKKVWHIYTLLYYSDIKWMKTAICSLLILTCA